jgi:hypothetical protein
MVRQAHHERIYAIGLFLMRLPWDASGFVVLPAGSAARDHFHSFMADEGLETE